MAYDKVRSGPAGLRASVMIKIPELNKDPHALEEVSSYPRLTHLTRLTRLTRLAP